MSQISRRQFLGAIPFGALSLGPFGRLIPNAPMDLSENLLPTKGSLLVSENPLSSADFKARNEGHDHYTPPVPSFLTWWDPSRRVGLRLSMPFQGHSIILHPRNPNLIFTSEKWGSCAGTLDLMSGKMMNMVHQAPTLRFFGHSAYSPSGDVLYTAEMNDVTGFSLITIRDAKTLNPLDVIHLKGRYAHEFKLINGGGTILSLVPVTNAITQLNWIDIRSKKVLNKLDLHLSHAGGQFAHFAMTDEGTMVAGGVFPKYYAVNSETSPPPLCSISPRGVVTPLHFPELRKKERKGEALSLAIDEKRNVFGTTVPEMHSICFWNYKTGAFLKKLKTVYPRGLVFCPSSRQFLVSAAGNHALLAIDAETLEFTENSSILAADGLTGNGPHITLF